MRIVSVVLFFLLTGTCYGQYDSILHKTFIEKRPFLSDFYRNKLKIRDESFAGKKEIIDGLRAFGKKNNDASLVTEADYAQAWLQLLQSPDKKMQTGSMLRFIQNCIDDKDYLNAARANRTLGELYWSKDLNYEQAFESYYKALETGKLVADDKYPEKMLDNSSLGYAFYFFKEYREAIFYLKEGLTHKPPHKLARAQSDIRNNLGLCYQKLGMLDSSDHYFTEIIKNKTDLHEEWKGIASGNLGYNQFLRGKYDNAMPLLQADIDAAIKFNEPGLASGSLVPMAEIYLKKNNIAKAESLALQAKKDIEAAKDFNRYAYLYPFLSKLYTAKGNTKLAQQYLDSSFFVKDSIEKKFSALQLARAQQKLALAAQKQEISQLEKDKKSKLFQRNLLIGFLVLLLIAALYVYNLKQKKNRQEQLLKDLSLEKKEKELQAAELQLKEFANSISQKSRLLEEMETQLRLKGHEDEKLIMQLQESTLLTDEQWNNFRQLFEKVHGGFLTRLKEKLPDLTPAEIRFMALGKLKFTTKEMAAALGVSLQAIRTTWYRLRKKLTLPEEGSMEELVNSI